MFTLPVAGSDVQFKESLRSIVLGSSVAKPGQENVRFLRMPIS